MVIGVAAMLVVAVWVHWHEVALSHHGIAHNSPPAVAVAVAVFLGVMLVAAIVAALLRPLRLGRGELVIIYAMLVVAAPDGSLIGSPVDTVA